MSSTKEQFTAYIHQLQNEICSALQAVDGSARFQEDKWERPEGGGGITRVIEDGAVFEKGGVNTSVVYGKLPEAMMQNLGVSNANFYACGLSLVLHPYSPMVPTVHANFRYFELYDEQGSVADAWFGGGADLTPYYLFEEDGQHFHRTFKNSCDRHGAHFYPDFKKHCDNYFVNKHRNNERRGLGGIFFDYCRARPDLDLTQWMKFTMDMGNSFLPAYLPIAEKRKHLEYTPQQKDWQLYRRGRYVEFNLIHDRGTLFGLKTNGRIESILMSLPPVVKWKYNFAPEQDSAEEKLLRILQQPIEWA